MSTRPARFEQRNRCVEGRGSQMHVALRRGGVTLGLTNDFSGCYVLLDHQKAFYVGISRKAISRLPSLGVP